jgi:phosphoribosylamine-glycine ligase
MLCAVCAACLSAFHYTPEQAKLLEHNVRFGDPECQGLMARLDSDLVEALIKVSRPSTVEGVDSAV